MAPPHPASEPGPTTSSTRIEATLRSDGRVVDEGTDPDIATGLDPRTPSVGVFFDFRNPEPWRRDWAGHYRSMLDVAVEAERLGAASLWVTEHHGWEDGYSPQPLIALAAFASITSRVRLGTGVVLPVLRHPRHVAEQAAMVDLVSGGRLELGMGAGSAPGDFALFDVDTAPRRSLTEQALVEIRDLLHNGGVNPPPVQSEVPMWLGYQGPVGARRAGELGVGLLSTDSTLMEPYEAGLSAGGHDPSKARSGGVVNLVVANDPDRTAERLVPHVEHHVSSYVSAMGRQRSFEFSPDDLRHPERSPMFVADVDEAIRVMDRVCGDLRSPHLYVWASVAGMPDDLVEEHLRLTFGEVVPRLPPT